MAEPVSLERIKQHLDVQRDDQNDLLVGYGVAAREWVESYTGLILTRREVAQTFAGFDGMTLAAWPVADDAVLTVRYFARGAAPVEIVGAGIVPGYRRSPIWPPAAASWPRIDDATVLVTVEAGYTTPADVPASLQAAILLLVGNLYANRESTVTGATVGDTGAVEMLCHPYRLPVIG